MHLNTLSTRSLVVALILGAVFGTGCTIVEDGEVGIAKSFGSIRDEAVPPGLTWVFPPFRSVETWNAKIREIKESANVPSSEGMIVELDVSLLYRVLPETAPKLRKTVGTSFESTLVVPYLRNAVRDTAGGYQVKDIYSEKGRKQFAATVLSYMRNKLGTYGVEVADVLLRDVRLPPNFKQSIERKLKAEQEAEQMEFELAKAKKDAEIEIARASGSAKAQEIVNKTLSPQYLQYMWIQAIAKNKNTIYVATESNVPLFREAK